ncbi:MAG: MDR family oxidoreductase [Anaerolineae bacterium]
MFKALVLTQQEHQTQAEIKQLAPEELPAGEVLVRVQHSTINYKDGLAVTGTGKIIRDFPMVPGIDFAGVVEESSSEDYKPGDPVILTGWGVGERHWGGYAQRARVQAGWLVPLPAGLTTRQAMAVGTAGFTAMLAVDALQAHGCTPQTGEVLVTGASGGVGSVAIAMLSRLGYTVVASTGRTHEADYLKSLGAAEVVDREQFAAPPERPLGKGRWAGAIDSVGGDTLANILSLVAYGGSVAAIGLAGGSQLNTTVLPFILRGVNLLGIDSVMAPKEKRLAIWNRLANEFPLDLLDAMTQTATLEDVPRLAQEIVKGQVRGRVVIDMM